MSLLEHSAREFVEFDPSNRQHRGWFLHFVRTGTWATCPVRCIVHDKHHVHGNIVDRCQRMLLDYYMSKEFGKTNP